MVKDEPKKLRNRIEQLLISLQTAQNEAKSAYAAVAEGERERRLLIEKHCEEKAELSKLRERIKHQEVTYQAKYAELEADKAAFAAEMEAKRAAFLAEMEAAKKAFTAEAEAEKAAYKDEHLEEARQFERLKQQYEELYSYYEDVCNKLDMTEKELKERKEMLAQKKAELKKVTNLDFWQRVKRVFAKDAF